MKNQISKFFRVVSVSGGKDSTATYLWAMDQGLAKLTDALGGEG